MPNFKQLNGSLHYLSDEDIANGGLFLLPCDVEQITDEEAEEIRNSSIPEPTIEQKRNAIKAKFTDTMQIKAFAGDPDAMALAASVATELEALENE